MRKPVVAGQFYEGTKHGLLGQLKQCFQGLEPGSGLATGAIVPHAGYMFSGRCAALGYSELMPAKTFMVLGFSHHGLGTGATTMESDWETPLGTAEADTGLINKLVSSGALAIDPEPQMHEHSIEVQIPFLQFLFRDMQIVPVSVSPDCDFRATGRKIAEATDDEVCIIASSDFTHYGRSFGYTPFAPDGVRKLDMGAVELIQKLDTDGFLAYVKRTGATICGYAAIALLMEIMKNRGARPKLIQYCTSADITGDRENSVSYVAMGFYGRKASKEPLRKYSTVRPEIKP